MGFCHLIGIYSTKDLSNLPIKESFTNQTFFKSCLIEEANISHYCWIGHPFQIIGPHI